MANDRVIQQADLRAIETNLNAIYASLASVNDDVGQVKQNVKITYDALGKLTRRFEEYVNQQEKANRLGQAETRLVKIRQELDKKYGHYDIVRRTTTGILQADDLGIVKKDTISSATEEMMISTPGYWLAPCLVALAAWINDQPELVDKAIREAIKRNDEETSLFFALVCRRADRKNSCLKWTERYLANQNEEDLDRKTMIIIDAFACGLLGADTDGVVSKQINEWLSKLEEKPNFVEEQTKQWSEAINAKRKPVDNSSYKYLKKYSRTWPIISETLEGAHLHEEMLNYLKGIFEQEVSTRTLKEELDDILDSLVTDFDDEELPLRKEEKYEQLIVDFGGDETRAKKNMAFDIHKDFTQLLTDAAMRPETSHATVSTQKFAFALSRDWVTNAYNDVVAQNRMKIPNDIEINIDNFNDTTTDGQNENELLSKFEKMVQDEKQKELDLAEMSMFAKFCLVGGAVITLLAVIMCITGMVLVGVIAAVAGIGMIINHFSKKKEAERARREIEDRYNSRLDTGSQIIRATLAEVVDYRIEFSEKDSESRQVIDYLAQLAPEQYRRNIDSSRKVRMQGGF